MVTDSRIQKNIASSRRRGLTLVEVLVVVSILAIVGLLMVPMGSRAEATRLQMAARRLVADLEYAQIKSIGNAEDPCAVVFNAADGEYFIARRSTATLPINNPATQTPYVVRFGHGAAIGLDGVTIDGINLGGGDKLEFDSQGALSAGTNSTITLKCGAATLSVSIDADTGEPSIP